MSSSGPSPILSRSAVTSVLDSMGIPISLSSSCQDYLVRQLEFRLRDLIDSSVQFMRHSRRHRLTIADLNLALKTRHCEPIYGYTYGPADPSSATTDSALDSAPLLLPMEDFFVPPTRILTLEEILSRPPVASVDSSSSSSSSSTVPIPREPTLKVEWLAVDGKKVSNPQPIQQMEQKMEDQLGSSSKLRKIQKEIEMAIKSVGESGKSGAAVGAIAGPLGSNNSGSLFMPPAPVSVSPALTVLLSPEHQVFFERVLTAVLGPDNRLKAAALQAVQLDDGLHQLLPHFSQWIADQTLVHLHSLAALRSILQLSQALLLSTHLHLEPFLHQILPAILTCILGKKLGSNLADHWSLRSEAAQLLGKLVEKYQFHYVNLIPRLAKTFVTALIDVEKPLSTHYGAVVGLQALGVSVIRAVLLPVLPSTMVILQPIMADGSQPQRLEEAVQVYHALLNAAASAAREEIQYKREIRLAVMGKKTSEEEKEQMTDSEEKEANSAANANGMEVEKKEKETKGKKGAKGKAAAVPTPLAEISAAVAESTIPSHPVGSIPQLLDLFGESMLPRIVHEVDWTPGPFGEWNPDLVDNAKPVAEGATDFPGTRRFRQPDRVGYDLASMFL